MKRKIMMPQHEVRAACRMWGALSESARASLTNLIQTSGVSVSQGDVQLLDGCWYVTHSGLLRLAHRRRCFSVVTEIDTHFSDATVGRWVFKATVFRSARSRGFVGYGDADPSNVSSAVNGAELRIAETRAVNRALRKAYGIGICSVEELRASAVSKLDPDPHRGSSASAKHQNNGQPRLRDQLCVLIRQHNLDPALVKSYAADFCGTTTLSRASRELIESFITHLDSAAKGNRESLICKLNSYAPREAKP